MNIPTKALRANIISYETFFHHQQLAKRFYKANKNNKKMVKNNEGDNTEVEQIPYPFGEFRQNFKEDLLKW